MITDEPPPYLYLSRWLILSSFDSDGKYYILITILTKAPLFTYPMFIDPIYHV